MVIIDPLVKDIFIPFLNMSYRIFPNYGVAIIALTVLVKIVFYPLNKKQFDAMKINQKLQPKLKEIQEKHKGDPAKAQSEIMALWKSHNTHPFSGCLPLLIQLPFFFGIFATMQSTAFKSILAQPHINPGFLTFWLSNLAKTDPYYILPVVIGIATYFSQKLFVTDPKQAALFIFMPFLMVFISIKMPAGALLYLATSQVLSVVQQYILIRLDRKSTALVDVH